MFDSLLDFISSSNWTYAVVFGLAALDVVFPLVPSETAVITAGVLSASGDLEITIVIACAAVGAILGDNLAYFIGHSLDEVVRRRIFKGDRKRTLEWAERTLRERGGYFIIIGRFIPGGRTAVTVAAGVLRYRWRRFIVFDAAAGILWATYAGLIGYFGGKAFEDAPWKGILVALGIAFAITGAVEVIRWVRRRRGAEKSPERLDGSSREIATGDGVDRG